MKVKGSGRKLLTKASRGVATVSSSHPCESRYNLRSSQKIPGLFLFDNDKGAAEGYLYYHSVRDDSFTTLHMFVTSKWTDSYVTLLCYAFKAVL